MLASERVLGPRWSQKELRTFYILLKAYGKQWERLEERLPSRTHAMIRALYDMHRGYLSLPEASAEGFCTIMTDHYKSLDELQQQELGPRDAPSGAVEVTTSAMDIDATPHPLAAPPPLMLPPLSMALTVEVTPSTTTKAKDESSSDTRSKKKRKLERFLAREEPTRGTGAASDATDAAASHTLLSSDVRGEDAIVKQRCARTRKRISCSQTPLSVSSDRVHSPKFRLPWFYWFYSYVDIDFFAHNEFIECLQRMQLGNLVKAARPIWSSVRSSMGHPRRLSPRFLAEEKQKLEHYREVKRRVDNTPSTRWPYKPPIALANGLQVLAHLSHPPRFMMGVIENFSAVDGVCKVRLDNNGSRVCSLDSIMILPSECIGDFSASPSGRLGSDSAAHTMPEQTYQDKLAAIALVKDLLKRKELLVNAMAKMNVQARILRYDFSKASSNSSSVETTFQRQYAWLVVNLDVTNRYLRAALLRLQDAYRVTKSVGTAATYIPGSLLTTSAVEMEGQLLTAHEGNEGVLTLEHMRWAVNFLTVSRKKASELVAGKTNSDGLTNDIDSSVENHTALASETKDLVANCISLASVVQRGSSPTIPPLITQKLMERMFELLTPRFDSNLDLYAELQSAAQGVALMQRQAQIQPQ